MWGKKNLGTNIFFTVLLSLFAVGCEEFPGDYRKTKLEIKVDLSQLPVEQLPNIDKIELTVSGVLPLNQTRFDVVKDSSNNILLVQDIAKDIGPVESSGKVYVRVAARMGTAELAWETKVLENLVNKGREILEFQLKIVPSPNDCKITHTQVPIFDMTSIKGGTFDVEQAPGGYLFVFVDQTNGRGLLKSVLLDSTGHPTSSPYVIDTDMPAGIESNLPNLVAHEGEYLLTWERYKTPDPGITPAPVTEKWVKLARLDFRGHVTATISPIATGLSEDARPTVAVSRDHAAVTWRHRPAGSPIDRVAIATFNALTLEPLAQARDLGEANESSGFSTIVPSFDSNGGFAVQWSAKAGAAQPYNLRFATMNLDLSNLFQRWTRQSPVGSAQVGRLTKGPSFYFSSWEDLRFEEEGLEEQVVSATINQNGSSFEEVFNVDPNYTESANWPNTVFGTHSGATVFYQFRGLNEGAQIIFTRIGLDGHKIGTGDIQISQNFVGEKGARFPDIVYTGTALDSNNVEGDTYGVFWRDETPEDAEGHLFGLMFAKVRCELN